MGKASSYDELSGFHKAAITEIIGLGGDTDTNSCIAGAIMGAFLGAKRIDEHFLKALFTFDCTHRLEGAPEEDLKDPKYIDKEKNPKPRPQWLNVGRNVMDSLDKLIKCRVKGNTVTIEE